MDDIRIRALTPSDREAVAFTKERIAKEWHRTPDYIDETYVVPSFSGGFPYVFIAVTQSGQFAGEVIVAIEEDGYLDIKDQPWIYGLFVKEEFRSRGIAQQLIGAAEEVCRTHGYPFLYLDTANAADYYRRIGGWEELGTAIWEDRGEEVLVMRKSLGGS